MLEARNLAAGFGRKPLFAGLNLALPKGQILGLEGPSGAGKTTLGRTLAGLHPALQGEVTLDGAPLPRRGRQPVQYLHQSPLLAMNPRWRIGKVLCEAAPVSEAHCSAFGIEAGWLQRYPHELSGGQLQRVSILRALAAQPAFLIADEITASLDQISQVQIWQLLGGICRREGIGLLAISHDAPLLSRIVTAGQITLSRG
ncbi:ABC transporter ATP-binding protein [Falsigemmobacter faecalis]|uniref:ATP-binding cassette domain-containing protein n=1 Tax=Falsigemmobacter faecalis TaxID=2488730 RepID=A0A3P3D339_9RHOB|nr:ATP-binding cassette domain-containing protein [Falsigemmobacter faecalis]RRH68847.1 ATP-binding cassette domain-containing protein [Falsigemmobacter faecalis]